MIKQGLGALLALTMLGVTACTGAVIGGATEGGYERSQPQRTADARLTARIQSLLVNDEVVGRYDIDVVCRNAVAVLRGAVPNPSVASRAISLARQVDGVVDVQSELRVTR